MMATSSGPDIRQPVTRTTTPWWLWVLVAVLAGAAAYGYFGMVQTQEELRTVKSERLLALRQAEEAASGRDALRQQLDELKNTQAATESQRQKIEADVKAASTRLSELQKRTETLEGELGAARSDLTSRDGAIDGMRRDLDAANAAKQQAEAATKQAQDAATAVQNEVRALSAKLTDVEAKLLAAQSEAEKLKQAGTTTAPPPPSTP